MIRTNLATRSFYNERAVNAWILIVALVVGLATIFNVTRVLRYSRSDTALAAQASRDETRAAELRQQASRLRATVDVRQLEAASVEARHANDLIDRRTFSWTELFNVFETTLPNDVRITAVRPRIDKQTGITLAMTIIARDNADVSEFIERLQETGAFANLHPTEEHRDDEDLLQTSLEATYVPDAAKKAPAEEAKPR